MDLVLLFNDMLALLIILAAALSPALIQSIWRKEN